MNTIRFADLPAVDQPLDFGTFAGLTTNKQGVHCAVAVRLIPVL